MYCDASNYELFVELSPKFKGVVDLKNHSGDEAGEVLALLISEGCSPVVRAAPKSRNGRHAIWDGKGFSFRNFLVNTAEVAKRVDASPANIVKCIKSGVLNGYPNPSGHLWLVVKDGKLDGLTHVRAISAKAPRKRNRKGRGLGKVVLSLACVPDFPGSNFGVEDLSAALESQAGWKAGRDYKEGGFVWLMNRLEKSKKVFRVVDGVRDVASRRWSFSKKPAKVVVSAPVVSEAVAPSPDTVSEMVEQLAGEIVSKAKQRARELLGL